MPSAKTITSAWALLTTWVVFYEHTNSEGENRENDLITSPFSSTPHRICESQEACVSQGHSFDTTKNCPPPAPVSSLKWSQLKHFCQNGSRSCGHTTFSGHDCIFFWWAAEWIWEQPKTTAKWIPDRENCSFWPAWKAMFSLMKKMFHNPQ